MLGRSGLGDGWRACAGTTRKDAPETNLKNTSATGAQHDMYGAPILPPPLLIVSLTPTLSLAPAPSLLAPLPPYVAMRPLSRSLPLLSCSRSHAPGPTLALLSWILCLSCCHAHSRSHLPSAYLVRAGVVAWRASCWEACLP